MSTRLQPTHPPQPAPQEPPDDLIRLLPLDAGRKPSRFTKARRVVVRFALVAALAAAAVWGARRWMTPGEKLGGEITATVAKSSLPITVVERGDLASSKTVDVRCE